MPMNPRLMRPVSNAFDFDPTAFGNVTMWLDASGDSGVVLNEFTDNVAVLKDKTGNGHDFAMATALYQPPYVRNAQNGRNAIVIPDDSSSRFLINSNVDLSVLGNTTDGITLFFVAKSPVHSTIPRTIYTNSTGTRLNLFHPYMLNGTPSWEFQWGLDRLRSGWGVDQASGLYEFTLPSVLSFMGGGARWYGRINNTFLIPPIPYSSPSVTGVKPIGLFNNVIDPNTNWRGSFYELLVYSGNLSNDVWDKVVASLYKKWGITPL